MPTGAPELIGAALRGAWAGCSLAAAQLAPLLPLCHVYAFSREADAGEDVLRRCAAALGVGVSALRGAGGAETALVRDVAPGKIMVRATFRLPPEAALSQGEGEGRRR